MPQPNRSHPLQSSYPHHLHSITPSIPTPSNPSQSHQPGYEPLMYQESTFTHNRQLSSSPFHSFHSFHSSQRETMVESLTGHVRRLIKHKEASRVVEAAYAGSSEAAKASLLQELFAAELRIKYAITLIFPPTPILTKQPIISLKTTGHSK